MEKAYFWTDGSRIQGARMVNAFLRGQLAERRLTPGGSPKWKAWCSAENCERTYDFSAANKPCARLQLCAKHLFSAVGKKGNKWGRGEGKKENYPTWTDGGRILSPRVREKYNQNLLTRRLVRDDGTVFWFARCEHKGCLQEYNLSAQNLRQCQTARCTEHVPSHPSKIYLPKQVVAGRETRCAFLIKHKSLVSWVQTKGRIRAYISCTEKGCQNKKQYVANGQYPLLCYIHSRSSKALEPFEALYR